MKDTKEKDPQIAASFMRAGIYDSTKFGHVVSMPKLNGLRCMYIPGRGFFCTGPSQAPHAACPTRWYNLASSGKWEKQKARV